MDGPGKVANTLQDVDDSTLPHEEEAGEDEI